MHLSPLPRKARRLGLDAIALEQHAIQRGCVYYHQGTPISVVPIRADQFSNLELAIALLNPALRYDPQSLRLGAAMLGVPGHAPEEAARLAAGTV